MTTTTNFGFNIPDGTDNVNLLTQNYPNWSNLDAILKAIKDTGITAATATKTGTNFAVVRSDADCKFFGFVALSNYDAGDSFTVDGVPVTATTPAGTSLPQGAFVINQSVLACLNGAVLTVYVSAGATTIDADDVNYDNTVSGLTAADVQAAIDELVAEIGAIPVINDAGDVPYDNTGSGLNATNVQAAIDELKALIPVQPQYITTGLLFNGVTLTNGGYYIENGIVYFDITVYVTVYRSGGDALIDSLPVAAGYNPTSPYAINATMDGVAVTHQGSGSGYPTKLTAMSAIGIGATVHYVGSYAYGA